MKTLWLFKEYFRAYKNRLILIVFLVLTTAVFEGVGIGLFYPLIEYVQKGEKLMNDEKFKFLFTGMEAFGIAPNVLNFILIIFMVIFFRFALISITQVASARTYNSIMKQIRDDSFKKIVNYPMFYFHSVSSGKVVSSLINEVNNIGNSLTTLIQIATNIAFFLVYTVVSFFISWQLTLMVIFIALIRYIILGSFIKKSRALGNENTTIVAGLNSYLISVYQGIDIIKSYATEEREIKQFKDKTFNYKENENLAVNNQAVSGMLEGVLGTGLICFVIYLAVAEFNINGSSVLLFLFIMSRMAPVVTNINDSRIRIAEYTSGIVYLKKIFEDSAFPVQHWGDEVKTDFSTHIKFEGVSFSYNKNTDLALKNITLTVHKNEKIAIAGESGAGKTTFTRLLLRLYNTSTGNIFIDDVNVNDLNRESWRKIVSVVSQDTFIFDDTVENNIKYSVEKCSDEEFKNSIKRARADDFIGRLPKKEQTELGERGMKLSGGERQRIAIARAFLRNSPILILDEATSSLDSVTETLIQDALNELSKNRTMIIIAHRLSTIKNANRIVVLDKGQIAEIGTHSELLENDYLYKKYHNLQIY